MAATGYSDGEGAALIAPMIGVEPDEIQAFVLVGIDKDNRVAFGASSAIHAGNVPVILRAIADGVEKQVAEGTG